MLKKTTNSQPIKEVELRIDTKVLDDGFPKEFGNGINDQVKKRFEPYMNDMVRRVTPGKPQRSLL